ncbi:hypothetical protein Tco_0232525 [Tanacetum coccineum]
MKESFKQMLKDVFKSGDKIQKRYIKVCKNAEKPCYSPNWDVDTRWNSTFEMFESGLKQKMTLAYFHDILVTKNGRRFKKFPDEYWVLIESLNPLLEVFQNATVILSGVSKISIAALNPCFNVSGVDYLIENISRDLEFEDDGFATRLLTIRRTRLTPESLEMCMCLKDHLDAHERKQNSSPLELPLDVEEGEQVAPDYMMSSGAEDDQTGEGGSMSHGYTYY